MSETADNTAEPTRRIFIDDMKILVGRSSALDRDDLIAISQAFGEIAASQTPLSYTVHRFASHFVSERCLMTLERIARAHDERQVLAYHNACQSAKEMLLGILFVCMGHKYDRCDVDAIAVATAGHYYGMTAEHAFKPGDLPYGLTASTLLSQEGLFSGLPSEVIRRATSVLCSGLWELYPTVKPANIAVKVERREDASGLISPLPCSSDLLLRNAYDAVLLSFCGVSYESFWQDTLRIETQTGREFGDGAAMRKIDALMARPVGNAQDTAFGVFFQRMLHHCVHNKRAKSAVN